MKKLINAPDAVVDEALAGMTAAHGDLLKVIEPNVIVRADAPLLRTPTQWFTHGFGDDLDAVDFGRTDGASQLHRPEAVVAAEIQKNGSAITTRLPDEIDDVAPIHFRSVVVHPREKSLEHRVKDTGT